jgi:hypothetical protein
MKGLNFSFMNPHSNLDMICAVESVVSKLPQTLGMEFRWRILSSTPNLTKKELKAVKSLTLNKDIRIFTLIKAIAQWCWMSTRIS